MSSLLSTQQAPTADAADESPAAVDLRWVTLLADLADQPTRAAALAVLAQRLEQLYPGGKLRVARGGDKLKEVLDGRLGRLGMESSLYHDLAVMWPRLRSAGGGIDHINGHRLPRDADDSESNSHGVMLYVDGHHFLILPQKTTLRHVVIWMPDDSAAAPHTFQQILPVAAPLAAVLASRPVLAVGRVGSWMQGLRSRFAMLALLALLVVALLPISYRVRCAATLEPVQQRLIAAPFDATLRDCHVRPGDRVRKSQVLLSLDGRPLQIERESLLAEQAQAAKQQSVALAKGEIADAQLAQLHVRQLQHQIDLLQRRLEDLLVRSPIDGIVVSGDLRRAVGSPLETGQTLLEVAPLDAMRVEVAVPENEVLFVRPGASAQVRFSALPTRLIRGQLAMLNPAAEIRNNENVFVASWQIDNPDDQLRPGMRGFATLYGPRRPLGWKPLRNLMETLFRAVGW